MTGREAAGRGQYTQPPWAAARLWVRKIPPKSPGTPFLQPQPVACRFATSSHSVQTIHPSSGVMRPRAPLTRSLPKGPPRSRAAERTELSAPALWGTLQVHFTARGLTQSRSSPGQGRASPADGERWASRASRGGRRWRSLRLFLGPCSNRPWTCSSEESHSPGWARPSHVRKPPPRAALRRQSDP